MSAIEMRAAVLFAPGMDPEVREVRLAAPGPGEVRVRLRWSGVCHSDLNVVDGRMSAPLPVVLGHEGAGIVEEVGPGVALGVGQPVALSWAPSCGACEECNRGLRHLCGTAWPAMATGGLMDGTPRLSLDGEPVFHDSFLSTYAEATVVPAASCVPIPDDAPLDLASIVGCAVTTGIGAVWNTAGVRPGDRVAVFGCGGVGLSAIMGARAAGAGSVVAVDVVERKLEDAAECGATDGVVWAGSPEETAAAVQDALGGGVDYAFECTGRSEVASACLLSTRARGAAVLVGIPAADAVVSFPALPFPRKELRVLGSEYGSAYPPQMFPLLLDLHRRGHLPLERLVSHRVPLAEVGSALQGLRDGATRRTLLDVGA